MDKKDYIIYNILNEDGRAKLTKISKKVELSHPSTKERLTKLLREEEIAVKALFNAKKSGWKTAVCTMNVESLEDALRLVDSFKKCPRVAFTQSLTGAYNLILIFIAEDTTLLESTIEKIVKPISAIKRLETSYGDAPAVPKYFDIKLLEEGDKPPCKLKDCADCYLYKRKCRGCPATKYRMKP